MYFMECPLIRSCLFFLLLYTEVMGLKEEDHKSKVLLSSYHKKGTYY